MDQSSTSSDLQYSGSTDPGLNAEASYDRMIWDGSQERHSYQSGIEDLLQTCIQRFRASSRSRLVIRTNIDCSLESKRLQAQLQNGESLDMLEYPNSPDGSRHITIGVNNQERAVPEYAIQSMQEAVHSKVAKIENEIVQQGFRQHALAELDRSQRMGMRFDTQASVDELYALWNPTFGWTREQCDDYANREVTDEPIFILRNQNNDAISGVLFSGEESTEWATLPEYQGNGYLIPLLIYSNCCLIRDGIQFAFAETRWNRSFSPAIKSGFELQIQPHTQWLLTNHVTVGDDPTVDIPDKWNQNSNMFGNETDGKMLRSFAFTYLNPTRFTPEILDAYLSQL